MGPDRNRRLATRHDAPTTEVRWRVPKQRRGGGGRLVWTEAAVIEVSSVGAGVVCPDTYAPPVGSLVEVSYGDHHGFVVIRRAQPLPQAPHLVRYGVEYVTSSANTIGVALLEVAVPAVRVDATGSTPIRWAPPR